jgi:hypothetical protein
LRGDRGAQVFAGERADLRGAVERIAGDEFARLGHELFEEFRIDGVFHDEAFGCDATLPGVLITPAHGGCRGGIEVGVG